MSVIHQILKEAALRCTRIDQASGYHNTVVKVWLPVQDGEEYTPQDCTIIVTAGEPERVEEHDRPGNPPAIGYLLPIRIAGIVIPSKFHSHEPRDRVTTRFGEDIIRAITDWPDWHRFGDLCINSTVGSPIPNQPDDETPDGIKVEIAAYYRVSETNPSEVRG